MLKELYFAFYAIKKNIQSSAELRASFLMNIVGMIVNNMAFIILWVFFVRSVGVIGGWTAIDIVGLQGFTAIVYGIIFSAGAGVRKISDYVASGSFDRFLLSPKNVLLRVTTSSFGVSAVGDIVFGTACLFIYAILIQADIKQIVLMAFLVVVSSVVFFAMALLIASMNFFLTDANLAAGGLFEIFFTPALFHGGAFQGVMRFIFTFLIPSLLIGTLPVEAVKGFSLGTAGLITLLALFWLLFAVTFFNYGIKKYESSNFMTFGN
jgi:ABC-2 type transport system permease protein